MRLFYLSILFHVFFMVPNGSIHCQVLMVPDSLVANKPGFESFQAFDSSRVFIKLKDGMGINLNFNRESGFSDKVAQQMFGSVVENFSIVSIHQTFTHLKNANIVNIYTVYLANSMETNGFIDEMVQHPWIEYAEHVPYYYNFYQPNDSLYFPNQLYLHYIHADSAWDIATGNPSIKIAIVDDAVLTTHEDLITQIWHNSGEITGDSIDNDMNGYIDDTTGYDVADLDNDPNPPNFLFTHGTSVAGIAGARSDNSHGVASVGYNVSIIPIKTKKDNSPGNILDSVLAGVEYAIVANADVINMSFGSALYSQVFQDLCSVAYDSGIVMVASAGNSGGYHFFYPASYQHVLSVGATDIAYHVTPFSTYNDSIDLMAPGFELLTTFCSAGGHSYAAFSGTSASAPLVSGTVALMLSNNPSMTPDEVEICIENGAMNIYHDNPEYFVGKVGAGKLDVYGALACIDMPEPSHICLGGNGIVICHNTPLTLTGTNFFPADTYFKWIFPGGIPTEFTGNVATVQYPYWGNYTLILIHGSSASNTDTTYYYNMIKVLGFDAFISPSGNTDVCRNGTAYVTVVFSHGAPPYTVCLTDGITIDTISGLAGPDYSFPVLMDTIHSYYVIWAHDKYCFANTNGILTLNPMPCTECTNFSFEMNDFTKWDGKLGHCCGDTSYMPGITSERMKISSSTAFDPHSSNTVVVTDTTDGNMHSAKLGNWFVGKESETLLRGIRVSTDNALLRLRYAVFLEDPYGHAPPEKPKFSMLVKDSTGNVLPGACTHYEVTAGMQTLSWSQYQQVRYTNWQTLMVDLSPYIGQKISVEFTTEDCGHGGHFGYAYVDAECLPLEIVVDNFCDSVGFITVMAPAGFESYLWSPTGDTNQTLTIPSWNSGDTVIVTMTNQLGCTSSIMHILQVLPQPVASLETSDTTLCAQQSILLTASGAGVGGTYHWTSSPPGLNVSADSIIVSPMDSTVYYVFAENVYHCVSQFPDSVLIRVVNNLFFSLLPDTMVCHDDSITLYAPLYLDSAQFTWTSFPPFFNDTGMSIVYAPQFPTWVILTATDSFCSFRDTTYVGFFPLMLNQPITHVYLCDSFPDVTFDAPVGSSAWYWIPTGDTVSSITINNPALYSIYQVSFVSSNGCDDTMRFIVDYMPPPNADAGNDTSACLGYTVHLSGSGSASPQATYTWTSIPTGFFADTSDIWVSPQVTTLYILEVSNGGLCPASSFDTVEVTVDDPPQFDLGPDIETCLGTPVSIYQNQVSGMNFWQSNPPGFISQDDFITVNPNQSTTYYLTVFVGNCFNFDSINVIIADTPKLLNDTNKLKACFINDSTALFTVPDGYDSYYWLQFDTSAWQIFVNDLIVGQQFLLLVHEPGSLCLDTLQIGWEDKTLTDTLMIFSYPSVFLCGGDSLQLQAWPQIDSLLYQWYLNTDSLLTSSQSEWNFVPGLNDSLVILSLSNGYCYLYDSIQIHVDVPLPTFPMNDLTLCFGDSLVWAIPDSVHQWLSWENGSTDSIRLITQTGLYSVLVGNGVCVWSDSAEIVVLPPDAGLMVPNIVTPNGDGFNDELCFDAPMSDQFSIAVYNRWGKLLYESDNPDECWDLRFEGKLLGDGTYFYTARFRSVCAEETKEVNGTITIMGGN